LTAAGRPGNDSEEKAKGQVMADGLNRVMLLGNLGADPELRVTAGGQPVLKLRLATTETYFDKNNTKQERTDWHSVTVWGKRGEALSKFLGKGERIFVEGRLQTSSYEKEGQKHYRTEVVASNIILAGRGRGGEARGDFEGGGGGGGGYRERERPAAAARAPQSQEVPHNDEYAGGGGAAFEGDDEIPF
jgi:single-strand DNA-binding protein